MCLQKNGKYLEGSSRSRELINWLRKKKKKNLMLK